MLPISTLSLPVIREPVNFKVEELDLQQYPVVALPVGSKDIQQVPDDKVRQEVRREVVCSLPTSTREDRVAHDLLALCLVS